MSKMCQNCCGDLGDEFKLEKRLPGDATCQQFIEFVYRVAKLAIPLENTVQSDDNYDGGTQPLFATVASFDSNSSTVSEFSS